VQVNGRVRGQIVIASDTPEGEIKQQALATSQVHRFTANQNILKVIYIPGRIVNVVTGKTERSGGHFLTCN
jgi:leucyl-tRNA synthetase